MDVLILHFKSKHLCCSFGVTFEMVEPFLEGYSLEEAIALNRIFLIDLSILDVLNKENESFIVRILSLALALSLSLSLSLSLMEILFSPYCEHYIWYLAVKYLIPTSVSYFYHNLLWESFALECVLTNKRHFNSLAYII